MRRSAAVASDACAARTYALVCLLDVAGAAAPSFEACRAVEGCAMFAKVPRNRPLTRSIRVAPGYDTLQQQGPLQADAHVTPSSASLTYQRRRGVNEARRRLRPVAALLRQPVASLPERPRRR